MTDKTHGNSIITRLRLIIERFHDEAHVCLNADQLRAEAENLLPLAHVDDIEVMRPACSRPTRLARWG